MATYTKLARDNWEVRIRHNNLNGKYTEHRQRGFTTKKEAEIYNNTFLENLKKRKEDLEGAITVSELLDEFFEFKRHGIKENTLKKYIFFTRIIKDELGNIYIKELTEKKLLLMLKKYDDRPVQQDRLRKFIKMSLDYGVIYCGLSTNPMNKIKLTVKKEKKNIEIWTYEEFTLFMEKLKERKFKTEDYKERAVLFFNLMYFSGARPGEISGLQKKDINEIDSLINIKRTRLSNDLSNSPKTPESVRDISIPTWLSKQLKLFATGLYGADTTYLFPPITVFQNLLKEIIDVNNLKHITLHGLRHSHVSLLINKGVDIATISKRVGHANPNITLQTYTHLYDSETKVLSFLEEM